MRQLPGKYHTVAYGPVYAIRPTEPRPDMALCCTAYDLPVACYHDELLPFDPTAPGADEIEKLEVDVDMGGPSSAYPRPRETRIGEWFLVTPIFFSVLLEKV
jgi:hypothetical protein